MADPIGAKHLPLSDYVRHESGAILPLPVQDDVIEDAQKEQYLLKKKDDKEKEQEELEVMEAERPNDAYDPISAEKEECYANIPWRSDFEIWFDGVGEEGGLGTNSNPTTSALGGKKGGAAAGKVTGEPVLLPEHTTEEPVEEEQTQKTKGKKAGKRPGKRVPGSLGAVMQLRQFEWNMLQRDFTVVAFGKRRSGKSFFMRDVLYHLRRCFPRGIVITRTAINGFWQKMVPDDFVHDEVTDELLRAYVDSQKESVELAADVPESMFNPRAFIVFEDCVDQGFRFNKVVEQLFYNGRHLKTFILVASQWCHSLHPGVRSNADVIVVFQVNSLAERQHIWETYFGFMPYEDFSQLLSRYTARQNIDGVDRHLFLGINNNCKSISRTDAMFWGYAEDTPNFILGCESYWGDELEKRHLKAIEKHDRLKRLREIP